MSRKIKLTKDYEAVIDKEDYSLLSQYSWTANVQSCGKVYAVSYLGINKKTSMARLIAQPDEDQWVDHINGDTLDNRKENLRVCSPKDNSRNKQKTKKKKTSSKYKGVCWHKGQKKWTCQIRVDGKLMTSTHSSEEEAALEYNKKALEYFGEFACLNEVLKIQ